MKKVLLGFLILSLIGCAKQAPITNDAVNVAKKTLDAIKATLPTECRTESVLAQIEALDAQINNIPDVCRAEIEPIKAERDEYRTKFLSVAGVLVVLIGLLIKKKIFGKI